jgi:hypothetical protein
MFVPVVGGIGQKYQLHVSTQFALKWYQSVVEFKSFVASQTRYMFRIYSMKRPVVTA